MPRSDKYDKILNALQKLLQKKDIRNISVSEIAQTAGIGKGSIYYYFPSKNAILEALVVRNYEKPIETAKTLSKQTKISPFTRMAMIFEACRSSSLEIQRYNEPGEGEETGERVLFHQKYISHLICELKPTLAEIIRQGIDRGEIHFSDPEALAEISLVVITVELDNSLVPSGREEVEAVLHALIELLEKGTENPPGSLNFLRAF